MNFSVVEGKNRILLYFPALSPGGSGNAGPVMEPLPVLALAPHLVASGFEVIFYDARLPGDFAAER